MTYARSQIAPAGEFGCFHIVTRCVRRAFLCGSDRWPVLKIVDVPVRSWMSRFVRSVRNGQGPMASPRDRGCPGLRSQPRPPAAGARHDPGTSLAAPAPPAKSCTDRCPGAASDALGCHSQAPPGHTQDRKAPLRNARYEPSRRCRGDPLQPRTPARALEHQESVDKALDRAC